MPTRSSASSKTEPGSPIYDVQVVYLDIVKYSLRKANVQKILIDKFTALCSEAINDILEKHANRIGASAEKIKSDVVKIPTGDGLAVVFLTPSIVEVHLDYIKLLAGIIEQRKKEDPCTVFLEEQWCNHCDNFEIRAGISEGKAILYTDINGNRNIAGSPINEAARIMGLADPMQALFSETAYRNLINLSDDQEIIKNFRCYEDVKVKHDKELNVYQYIGDAPAINVATPSLIENRLSTSSIHHQPRTTYIDFENAAIDIVDQFECRDTIDVLKRNPLLAFPLFPSFIKARLEGKTVRLLCEETDEERERQCIGLLTRAGCEVRTIEKFSNIRSEMFLFDSHIDHWQRSIVIVPEAPRISHVYATRYDRNIDRAAIQLFQEYFDALWENATPKTVQDTGVAIKKIDFSEIVSRLRRGVPQYSPSFVSIEYERVPINRLQFLASHLKAFKIRQAPKILALYEEANAELFEPLAVFFPDNKFSIITPPVVEECNGKLIVLNGSHRCYYSRKHAYVSEIGCIIVRGVKESLPGIPVTFESVRIEPSIRPSGTRIQNFNYDKFRRLESAVHPPEEVWV